MTRNEYEDLIFQDDVFSEELLANLADIVRNEGVVKTLVLVSKLKQTPIPQQFLEVGMSVQQYYRLGLSKQEADSFLYVIHMAQQTNNKKTTYKLGRLLFLAQKWQKYCDSFR